MFDNLAQKLFGAKRAESDSVLSDAGTNTIHGTAVTDSSNGSVMVELSSDVTNPDPIEVDGEMFFDDADISVELPTTQNVKEGDDVLVSVLGNTPMRSPVVTGVVGSGDRIAQTAEQAETLAGEAWEVAEAVGQHVWTDDDGLHITEITQEEWETNPSGANQLMNSNGTLIRDGEFNQTASTPSGYAIYDGQGNADGNIVASIGPSEVNLVRQFDTTQSRTGEVNFFGGLSFLRSSWNTISQQFVTRLVAEKESEHSGKLLSNAVEMINQGTATEDVASMRLFGGGGRNGLDPATIGLMSYRNIAQDTTSRYISMEADYLNITDGTNTINTTMEHLIDVLTEALPVTLFTGTYSETVSSAITLSESAANFSRLRIEWEAGDGYRGSTELSNPNGAKFMCSGMVSGSGTNPTTFVTWKIYEVVGTRISNWKRSSAFQRGQINIHNSGNPTTNRNELIGITKVLGWR